MKSCNILKVHGFSDFTEFEFKRVRSYCLLMFKY